MDIKLQSLLDAWQGKDFNRVAKQVLQELPSGVLPLQRATNQGGVVDDSDISVSLTRTEDLPDHLVVIANIFFTEVVAGCNCADDPMEVTACCDMKIRINKQTAKAEFFVC